MAALAEFVDHLDTQLTLTGLRILYDRNTPR